MGTPFHYREPDRNHEYTVFASAARTATENSQDMENVGCRGVWLMLNMTAASGTPTLDLKVQRKCPLSDIYVDLPGGTFAQKTGTGTDDLTIYPGITDTANESVNDVISSRWRVVATIGGGTPSITFSLTASMIR